MTKQMDRDYGPCLGCDQLRYQVKIEIPSDILRVHWNGHCPLVNDAKGGSNIGTRADEDSVPRLDTQRIHCEMKRTSSTGNSNAVFTPDERSKLAFELLQVLAKV